MASGCVHAVTASAHSAVCTFRQSQNQTIEIVRTRSAVNQELPVRRVAEAASEQVSHIDNLCDFWNLGCQQGDRRSVKRTLGRRSLRRASTQARWAEISQDERGPDPTLPSVAVGC